MTCIELDLGRNETLGYSARRHWLYKVGARSSAAVACAGAYHALAGIATIANDSILSLQSKLTVWTSEIGVTNQ